MSEGVMAAEVDQLIRTLALSPHPEGGFYREIFRSSGVVQTTRGERSASTAIYFLLPAREISALHRVSSDEVWHHYAGGPVELHLIDASATHQVIHLGKDLGAGQHPMWVVPAGVWQAAVAGTDEHALCGCTVAPGFDFADFEMPGREELLRRFPSLAEVVRRLTREPRT
jgi:hypothetical protein